MTDITIVDRPRNVFVSGGGNNALSGFNDLNAKKDMQNAIDAVTVLAPTLGNPVNLGEFGSTRYVGNFTFPDFCRVNVQDSSIAGQINLPGVSFVRLASILTTGVGGETAVNTNSKNQTSIICFGIVCQGSGDVGHHISGVSSENFSDVGQVSCNADSCTLIKFDTTGTPKRLQYNELNIGSALFGTNPSNCTAFEYNSTNPASLALNCSAISNDGSGTGNTGLHIIKGDVAAFCNEIAFPGQDAIVINDGGHLDIIGAHIEGDITVDIGGVLNILGLVHHDGSLNNSGVVNGIINGIRYGTYVVDNDYLATFIKAGNMSSTFQTLGRISLDATTDTVTAIEVVYFQGTSNSRTIDFQVLDADDLVTVYFTATNTETSVGNHVITTFTPVTALPSVLTPLELQIKDNGSQCRDASVSIYFTRTP